MNLKKDDVIDRELKSNLFDLVRISNEYNTNIDSDIIKILQYHKTEGNVVLQDLKFHKKPKIKKQIKSFDIKK